MCREKNPQEVREAYADMDRISTGAGGKVGSAARKGSHDGFALVTLLEEAEGRDRGRRGQGGKKKRRERERKGKEKERKR